MVRSEATRTRTGWRRASAAVASLALLALGSCGSEGVDHADGSAPTTTAPNPAEEAVELLAAASASSLFGEPVPGGGFVAFGVGDPDGTVRRDVVVFDAAGTAISAFELPERIAPLSWVVAGGDLHLIGHRCDDRPWENDVGQQQCRPGNVVGVVADLATGQVDDLPLPVEGNYVNLLRIGDRAAAFDWGRAAWILDEGAWQPIDAPPGPGFGCQVDDRVVADVTDRSGLRYSGTVTGDDLDDRFQVVPAVQVLDPVTLTWGEVVTGPPLTVSLMGLSQRCTAGRVTVAATFGGAPADGGQPSSLWTSFDLATSTWSDVVTVDDDRPLLHSYPEADVFVTYGEEERKVIDPVSAVASPPARPLPTAVTGIVNISGTRALVFDPADPGDRLEVIELVDP